MLKSKYTFILYYIFLFPAAGLDEHQFDGYQGDQFRRENVWGRNSNTAVCGKIGTEIQVMTKNIKGFKNVQEQVVQGLKGYSKWFSQNMGEG